MTARRGLVLVVLGALCWGAGGLSGALLGREAELDSSTVGSYRLLGSGLALVIGLMLAGGGRLRLTSRAAWARVATVAVLIAVFQAAYFQAVYLVGVAVATLVTLGSAPVLVASAQAVRRRRLPEPRVQLAILAAAVGLALLVIVDGERPAGASGSALLVGVGLALLAGLAFATIVVVNRRAVPGLGPLAMTGVSFAIGGVLLIPLAALRGGLALPATPLGWWWLAFLALVPTALAYALYFSGLPAAGATSAAVAALLEPLAAALLAVLVLGERLGLAGWCGAALLVSAVVLARPRPGASPTMDHGPRAARGLDHASARAGDDPLE